jgi:hypothetical protein
MIRIFAVIALVALAGCDKVRSDVKSQVEDYAVCQKAGMGSYLNAYSEVRCMPPKGIAQ